MTNQDIAKIYGVSFQKIIGLIQSYSIDAKKLRKVENYCVYLHLLNDQVVYVGSGNWYRCRRYTNRRNSEHRHLMERGKIQYKFIKEFEEEDDARALEARLILKYKSLGQAKFNKKLH